MTVQPIQQLDSLQGNSAVINNTVALGNADSSQVFAAVPTQSTFFVLEGTIASATVVVEASYDGGATYLTLKDSNNAAMSYTATTTNPVPFVMPAGAGIRVRSSGGAGSILTFYIGFAKAFI